MGAVAVGDVMEWLVTVMKMVRIAPDLNSVLTVFQALPVRAKQLHYLTYASQSSIRWVLRLPPFYRWRSWGREGLSNWPQVTQSGRRWGLSSYESTILQSCRMKSQSCLH